MKSRHWIAVLIGMVAVGGALAWHYWPRTVPLEECSGIYQHYHDNPHVVATFLKDFRVNDTVTVDVTLLEAKDDEGWEEMMEKFGIIDLSDIPDEVRHLFAEKTKAIGFSHYEEDDEGEIVNIVVYSRIEKSVYLFHTKKDAEIKAIFTEKITETTQ